jgi:hypothetical protein
MSYAYPKPRQRVWRSPLPADVEAFLVSSRAAHEPAKPPATATETKLLTAGASQGHLVSPRPGTHNLLTFWELWEAMQERGGFYCRKMYWQAGSRFCVASVVDHSAHPGVRIALGRFYDASGTGKRARLTKDLELRLWEFGGVTGQRVTEDCAPIGAQA